MNEGLKKFRELLLTDEGVQKKLQALAESQTGDKSPESIFHDVLEPVAQEYGISATYEEFMEYLKGLAEESDKEINELELSQIAGGSKGGGLGSVRCFGIGFGAGAGGGSESSGVCATLGIGYGYTECFFTGSSK